MADTPVLPQGFNAPESNTPLDLSAVQLPDVETGQQPSEPQAPDYAAQLAQLQKERDEYEQRFKGLQGTVQREVEARRNLEAQYKQAQAEAVKAQIQSLPQGQREIALRQWELEQREATIAQQSTETENIARLVVAQGIAAQYPGVSLEELTRLNSPEEMQAHAQQRVAMAQMQQQLAQYQQLLQQAGLQQAQQPNLGLTPPGFTQTPLSPAPAAPAMPPNPQPQFPPQPVNFGPASSMAMAPQKKSSDWDESLSNLLQDPRTRRI